jgi:N-acetylglutamate synthase-like GNAT family acetyltransferase
MNFRPATLDDLIAFNGRRPEMTMRAFVAEEDGKVLATGGTYYSGGSMVVFCDLGDEIRKSPKSILKGAKYVMEKVRQMGVPVVALCSKTEPTAPGFLNHLGFEFARATDQGDLYQWTGG